ncbi:MAG: LysE family transporter [Aeropyrum sp.]|nr:LysE family transporter [Aeropyrum sp.]MCE4616925.1 LysE family transporter [Aeropyrum sp.]
MPGGSRHGGGSSLGIIIKTLIITPSGALSPGPLSFAAIVSGAYLGWIGGFYLALGHMLFEMPFLVILWRTSGRIEPIIRRYFKPLSTIISVFILYFAYLSLDAGFKGSTSTGELIITPNSAALALFAGIILTGANPHFLLWWVSAGFPLVTSLEGRDWRSFGVMYVSHVWMDYAWLLVLAGLGDLTTRFGILYTMVMTAVGIFLALIAADMLSRAWVGRKLLPF